MNRSPPPSAYFAKYAVSSDSTTNVHGALGELYVDGAPNALAVVERPAR